MKRWPLLLPPPAVSTSPSHSRRSLLSIILKSPLCRSLPSSCCRRAVHCCITAPSITVHSPSCCPLPPIAVVLLVHHRRARTVPRCRGAIAPSIAIKEPSRRTSPSRSRQPCRLTTPATRLAPPTSKPLFVRLVVTLPLLMLPPPNCRRLSLRPSPFVPLVRPASCPISSILTPPPPICRGLRLSSHRRVLLSRPSRASRPAG